MAGDLWPPYTGQDLPENGLSVDIIRTALGRAGYKVTFVEVPWERTVRGLEQGRYDLINDWYTARHVDYASYGHPFARNRVRWVMRHDDDIRYDGRDSLLPYRIALTRGYAYSDELAADEGLNKGYAVNFVQAARMLMANRVDLALEDERTARFHFDRALSDVRDAFSFVPGEFSLRNLSLVVRKSHPDHDAILAAFEREIVAMFEDGSYAAIFRRHGLPVPAALPQP